jgi:hypothetical protein
MGLREFIGCFAADVMWHELATDVAAEGRFFWPRMEDGVNTDFWKNEM